MFKQRWRKNHHEKCDHPSQSAIEVCYICLKIGYIPKQIAIRNRDNDQQNHWVDWGTLFSDKPMDLPWFSQEQPWILWWNMLMIRCFFESLASHPLVSIGCGSRLSNPRSRECRSHPRCPEADPAAIPEAMYSRCVSFQDFGGGWLPSNKLFVYIYSV